MRIRSSRLTVGVLLSAVVLLLTSCTSNTGRFSTPSVLAVEPSDSALSWERCTEEGEQLAGTSLTGVSVACATLSVPLDWENPDTGATTEIALMRIRSRLQEEDRVGSLLVNPGGPGASGRGIAALTPLFFPQDILRNFDIVGFDPRGVGASDPVHCISDEEKDKQSTQIPPNPRTQEAFDAVAAVAAQNVAGCEADKRENLLFYNTLFTAHDMDAVRAALGEEKLTYLGYSYGSLLGYVYAHEFPQNIRAMVLDGAVDPEQSNTQASEGQAAAFEKAFDNFADRCRAQGDACPIGPDARVTVEKLLQDTSDTPVPASDGRHATANTVLSAIVASLYTQQRWPQLIRALDDVQNGNGDGVFALADQFGGRQEDGTYDNSTDANITINCVDGESPGDLAAIRQYQETWSSQYPLFGGPLAMTLLECAQWPEAQHHPYPTNAVQGAPGTMVIGTTQDPATPYANTQKLATLMGDASVVTQEGEGHTAYPQTQCVTQVVNAYLIETTLPSEPLRCS